MITASSSAPNIAAHLHHWAKCTPHQAALSFPRVYRRGEFHYAHLDFAGLLKRAEAIAQGLDQMGLDKGARCLVFLRPSLSFSAVVFALFKVGLTPVFIDPGMKREYLWQAIRQMRPQLLIAGPLVHWMRPFFPRVFHSLHYTVTTSRLHWPGRRHVSLKELEQTSLVGKAPLLFRPEGEFPAAILFTSGGTGAPKGVVYTHSIFQSQVRQLQALFNLRPGQVDLPGFPLFSLFALCMGMKSAIPALDPRRPARADPALLYQNIVDQQAQFMAGSPAIWQRLGAYCHQHGLTLPSVRSLAMFGAPVARPLHDLWRPLLPNGETYSAYGATECLPVAVVSGRAVQEGKEGVHLGTPAPGVQVRIVPVEGYRGRGGEIAVHSASVTPAYAENPEATARAKFKDGEGRLWHRMGDLGHIDEAGHLWMQGRVAHLVHFQGRAFASVPCEAVFGQHPQVVRSALIAYHSSEPAIVVEAKKTPQLGGELLALAQSNVCTRGIQTFFCHSHLPVDIRHNIKIDRTLLGQWACSGKLGRPLPV